MNNINSIINFTDFAQTFSPTQLKECFEVTSNPKHLESKFKSFLSSSSGNGTEAFYKWFCELSNSNKNSVALYITENHSYLRVSN